MSRKKQIVGQRFGSLLVIKDEGDEIPPRYCLCVCSCGYEGFFLRKEVMTCRANKCSMCKYKEENSEALKNFLGKRFGSRIVIGYSGTMNGFRYYRVVCECGNVSDVCGTSLTRGDGNQCSKCRQKKVATTHGLSGTKVYKTWNNIHTRCGNPKYPLYKDYGGRGIKVCDRWKKFETFFADMGQPPGHDYDLHRIDNDKGYSKENCMWIQCSEHVRLHHKGKPNPKKITKKNIDIALKKSKESP